MLGKPIYCVGGQYSTEDVVEEIKRQTGREAKMIGTPTSGSKDLDDMYDYYNEWGVYRDVQIPHPETTDLGLTFSSLSDFVREAALPYSKTLTETGLNPKGLGLTVAVS